MTDQNEKRRRREAMERLAGSIRTLCDAAVSTGLPPDAVDAVREQVEAATETLLREQHDGPYSGLMQLPLDHSDPHALLPLSPIIGRYNPTTPDVELGFDSGSVRGRARLGKRHIGPPGAAHGGIMAMIADQLIAVAPFAIESQLAYVTRRLTLHYRAPTPLYRELVLEARCDPNGDGYPERVVTRGSIRAGERTTVEIEAETVAAPTVTQPRERTPAPRL